MWLYFIISSFWRSVSPNVTLQYTQLQLGFKHNRVNRYEFEWSLSEKLVSLLFLSVAPLQQYTNYNISRRKIVYSLSNVPWPLSNDSARCTLILLTKRFRQKPWGLWHSWFNLKAEFSPPILFRGSEILELEDGVSDIGSTQFQEYCL